MILQENWDKDYYNTIMSILAYIMSSDKYSDEDEFVNSRAAAEAFDDIETHAFVHTNDFDNSDFSVRISATDDVMHTVDRYFGYTMAGGFYPDFKMKNVSESYSNDVLERSKTGVALYLAKKEKRENNILARIKDYIAECEKNGVKPVKKHLVTEEYDYNTILEVWRKYENGEYETKFNFNNE